MTAVAAIAGCFSTWFSSVVLPLPRNPVSTVTGMRASALLGATATLLRSDPCRLSRVSAAASRLRQYCSANKQPGEASKRLLPPLRRGRWQAQRAEGGAKHRSFGLAHCTFHFRMLGLRPLHHASHGPPPPQSGGGAKAKTARTKIA